LKPRRHSAYDLHHGLTPGTQLCLAGLLALFGLTVMALGTPPAPDVAALLVCAGLSLLSTSLSPRLSPSWAIATPGLSHGAKPGLNLAREAPAAPIPETRPRLRLVKSPPRNAGALPLPTTGLAPLQRLAQRQRDQRFLGECRRSVLKRWHGLASEAEQAAFDGRIAEVRWPIYQLRVQSELWGATAMQSAAQDLEHLLDHPGFQAFQQRLERQLASLHDLIRRQTLI
jgi:hypothetical protein